MLSSLIFGTFIIYTNLILTGRISYSSTSLRFAYFVYDNLLTMFIIFIMINIVIIAYLYYLDLLNNSNNFKQHLTANLLKKIGITVSTTAVIFIILLVFSYVVYHQFYFQGDDLIYQLAQLIEKNLLVILFLAIIIDTMVIFWLRYRESLSYLEKMLEAGKVLVSDDDSLIQLPKELHEIENQMNQIKLEALYNKEAIKQAEKQKNDLLLYLAHDLKTPLTSIIGYLDLLVKQPNLSIEEKSNYTNIAYDKAMRLEELIEEFFTIAKYNLSDIELECVEINLSMMLQQISYEFMPLYHDKSIECVTKIEDNLTASIDPNLFERVFDNLIRNAINYSTKNSQLIITAKKNTNKIIITVTNQIDNQNTTNIDDIFQPFVRLDAARSSKTGGSGLGLAITKKIVELHHGTINAKLTVNLITFTIELPL